MTVDYLLRSDYQVKIENTMLNLEDQIATFINGRVRWPNPPSSELEIKYSAFKPWHPYKILETDYTNYAITHQCYKSFGVFKHDHLWVLTREAPEFGSKLWNAYKDVAL